MIGEELYRTFKRYRALPADYISTMPLAVLMPHSACNCRCVMCDIWKGNANAKQLTENDMAALLQSFKQLGTRMVLMSGGEALLNRNFFDFCEILKKQQIKISLLSTGLVLKKYAEPLVKWVDDIIVSLDGPSKLHDQVRNVTGAFEKMQEGIHAIKQLDPTFRITARTVIHRVNYGSWAEIVDTAKGMGLNQVSFLPADVTSHAFNREVLWTEKRQHEILPGETELHELHEKIEILIREYANEFTNGFIAESPDKIRKIYSYYAAFYGINPFPYKKCNAPWVSAVVEADGTVRPCFFHAPVGNIHDDTLAGIVNNETSTRFRKQLDIDHDPTCEKCVCHLYLKAGSKLF